jgi:hypothetical protein
MPARSSDNPDELLQRWEPLEKSLDFDSTVGCDENIRLGEMKLFKEDRSRFIWQDNWFHIVEAASKEDLNKLDAVREVNSNRLDAVFGEIASSSIDVLDNVI